MTWADCETTLKTIGFRVRQRRLSLGLTQDRLASRTKILGRTSIVNIESGRQKMTVLTLCAIARALEVEPGVLLNGALEEPDVIEITVNGETLKVSQDALEQILSLSDGVRGS